MKARGAATTGIRLTVVAAGLLLLLAAPRPGRGQTANVLAVLPEGVVLPAAPFAELRPGSRFGFRRADGSSELVGEGWVLDVREGRALVALRPGGVVQPGDVAVLCATLSGSGPDAEFRASLQAIKTQLDAAGGGTPEVQATIAELDAALAARATAIRDGGCDVAAHDQQIAELSLQLQRTLAAAQASPAAPPSGESSAAGEAETAQGAPATTTETVSEASAGPTAAPPAATPAMETIAAALQLVQQAVQIAQSAGLLQGGTQSAPPPPPPVEDGGLTQTLLPTTPGSEVEAPASPTPGTVVSPPPSGASAGGTTPPPFGPSTPTGPPLAGGSGSSAGGSPAAGGGPPASGDPPSGGSRPPGSSRPPGLIRPPVSTQPPVSAPSWTRIPLKPAPAPGMPSTSGGDAPSAGTGAGSSSFRPLPAVALTPRARTLPESGGTTAPGTGASTPGGVTPSPRTVPPIALTPRSGLVPPPGGGSPGSAGAESTAGAAKSQAAGTDGQATSTVKPVTPVPLLPGRPQLSPGSVKAGGALTARVAPAQDGVATVRGTVRNADGTPLANAVVLVGGRRAATNAKGLFLVDEVPPGRQMLVVTAPGFARRTLAMELSVGRVEEVTLTLQRAPLPRGPQ
jgi:hypothetical protein